MVTSKWGWVSKQLGQVKPSTEVHETTVALLSMLDKLAHQYNLTDDEQKTVLEYVRKLALKHALVVDNPDEKWGAVIPGEYNVRDKVRVREDAYAGVHGERHNGKRGRIVAVHQSRAVVIYDDAKNSEESFHHEPENLERLL